ncbi:MAG: ABC transporter substrate-binding protein [Gammaproteobacteria bacterium]|nr:ABC transporter substrate-binding protein [Gammaproteobacteria bacterium]
MKTWSKLIAATLIGSTMAGSSVPRGVAAQSDAKKLIYMAVWRGCEEACEAFKYAILDSGVKAEVVVRDANRDKSVLPKLVAEARDMNADLVVTWGTSVTRGMVGTLDEVDDERFLNERPVVFMIVADPIGARIIESYEKTGRANVTGTRNRVPEEVNINAIRSYYPEFARLGMLYNTNEKNSVIKVEEMRELGARMGFELVALELELDASGHPDPAQIPAKVKELKERGADFIYVGSSSFLTKNQDVFTEAALEQKIPVLSPYENMVRKSHALLSVAARYADVGVLAAEQSRKILAGGATPGDLPVVAVEQFAYVVNLDTARRLNLLPPIDVLQIAETVN